MKTKSTLLLLLCAALGIQCSDDNGGNNDQIIVDPPVVNELPPGYTDLTNARLVVTGVDSVVASPAYAYVSDWILGDNAVFPGQSTNATEAYFDDTTSSFLIKFPENEVYTPLCVNMGWFGAPPFQLHFPQWDLEYSYEEYGDLLVINGKGRGSHVLELYQENYEAFEASEIVFEFSGVTSNGYWSGPFSIVEKSPEASYNLAIYGTIRIYMYR